MKAIELMPFDLVYYIQKKNQDGDEPDETPNLFPDQDLTGKPEPVRITGTDGKAAGVISWEWYGQPDKFSFWASYGRDLDWLQPIPLSNDILKRNGFQQEQGVIFDEYNIEGWYILNVDDRGELIRIGYEEAYCHLKIGNTSNDNCWLSISVYYVHQLQQLLRFLGFYEFANNFKL